MSERGGSTVPRMMTENAPPAGSSPDAAEDAGAAFDVQPGASTEVQAPADGADALVVAADGKANKEGDENKPDAGLYGAPEAYADFTLPDGMTLDSEMLAEFAPVLKELNLSQESAQKVINFAPKLISQTVEGIKAQLAEEARGWHDAARGDKEIGGAKMVEHLAVANKAFAKFGTPELKAFLASRGLNAHPELIRAFYRAGKAISEDQYVPGGATVSRAKPFYDNSRMN